MAGRADTGEIVHHRLRKGSSQKGNTRFVTEAVNLLRRAGATGPITVRADKGFWSRETVRKLEGMGVEWFIAIPRYSNVKQAIDGIDDSEWADIGYTEDGVAQVAETTISAKIGDQTRELRLVVRRTRLSDQKQQQLWPDWRHHTFATNNTALPATEADRTYRKHARVELGVRDLKNHTGLAHCPSGRFFANAAWMACAVLAHNLYRWINHHAGTAKGRLTCGATVRNRLFNLPGRVVNHSRRLILRLPARWPWAHTYRTALDNIRSLPQLC